MEKLENYLSKELKMRKKMERNIAEQQNFNKLVDFVTNPNCMSNYESIKVIKEAMPTVNLFGDLHSNLKCTKNDLNTIARKIMILMS